MVKIDEVLEKILNKVEITRYDEGKQMYCTKCPLHNNVINDTVGQLIIAGSRNGVDPIGIYCADGCSEKDLLEYFGIDPEQLIPDTRKQLSTITAKELQEVDFPPLFFIVNKLIPHGVVILAAAPKIGKSWFVLDMCLQVSAGERFLNRDTTQGGCLYLALEDTQRRLQDRMNKILQGKEAPDGFSYATSAHDIDNGLLEELEVYMEEHPETTLIVIDTLEKVRPLANGKDSAYSKDYKEIGALKAFADEYDICILVVHHFRKMIDSNDTFNMVSGTNGLIGAADASLTIQKESRDSDEAKLSVTGRDVEQESIMMKFNKDVYRWENIGNAQWIEEQRQKLEYRNNPIVMTIKSLLHEPPHTWSGTATDLLNHCRRVSGEMVATSAQNLTTKVQKLSLNLKKYDGIEYSAQKRGSGSKIHSFQYTTDNQWIIIPEQEEMDNVFE